VESHINKGLAYQLRAMREARNWSQGELAALIDMPQTAISRLESPNYGKPTITTLKRVARVYDVGLDVRFVPFSLLVDRMSKTPHMDMGLTSDSVDVPSYEEEEEQGAFTSASIKQIPAVTQAAVQVQIQDMIVAQDTSGMINTGLYNWNLNLGRGPAVWLYGCGTATEDAVTTWYQSPFNTEALTNKTAEFIAELAKKSPEPEASMYALLAAKAAETRTGTYD